MIVAIFAIVTCRINIFMEIISQWATIIGPIISAFAIVVALSVAKNSSKDAKRQIEAVYNLLDVFVAAHNLDIIEAQRKYQQALGEINCNIEKVQDEMSMVPNALFWGNKIDKFDAKKKYEEKDRQLKDLIIKRKEIEANLSLIKNYIEKSAKRYEV